MEGIAPWLQFTPSTFASAAEAGQRLGQGQQQIDLERARLAQSAAQAAAQLNMEGARLDAASKQAAQEHQLQTDHLQQNFLRDQANADITRAYHEATIGLGKQKLDQTGQQKALQVADTQSYWLERQAGKSHADAMAAHPYAHPVDPAAGTASSTESVTMQYPESQGSPAIPGTPGTPAYDRAWYNPARYLAGKTVPAIPDTAEIPATDAHPAYTVTRRIPSVVSPQEAYRSIQPQTATAGAPQPPQSAIPNPQSAIGDAASPAKEVIRITKDGKRAIFNADTKAFLRYAD